MNERGTRHRATGTRVRRRHLVDGGRLWRVLRLGDGGAGMELGATMRLDGARVRLEVARYRHASVRFLDQFVVWTARADVDVRVREECGARLRREATRNVLRMRFA